MPLKVLRAAGDVPNAASILQRDVYGWFERVERGTYRVSPEGLRGIERFGEPAVAAPKTVNGAALKSIAR